MSAFVEFTWRIRYLIWLLVAVGILHFCYTLWNGTNFFIKEDPQFWSGFVFGAVTVAMVWLVKATVPPRKPE